MKSPSLSYSVGQPKVGCAAGYAHSHENIPPKIEAFHGRTRNQSVKRVQRALSGKRCWKILPPLVLFLSGLIPHALGQSGYSLQIVAKTGDKTPGGNTIVAFGTEPSINDAGKVAFTIQIQDGRIAVFKQNGSAVEKDFGLYTTDLSSTAVQINNSDQITVRDVQSTGETFILRLQTGNDPLLGVGSDNPIWDTPVQYLLQWLSRSFQNRNFL